MLSQQERELEHVMQGGREREKGKTEETRGQSTGAKKSKSENKKWGDRGEGNREKREK